MKSKAADLQAVVLPNGKKRLDKAFIDREFRNNEKTITSLFLWILGVGILILLGTILSPVIYTFTFPAPFLAIRDMRKRRRRRRLEYVVFRRTCLQKSIAESDESPDEYLLWFLNPTKELNVAATVAKEYYDATEVGEEFIVVFAKGEKLPVLWYRGTEWELV